MIAWIHEWVSTLQMLCREFACWRRTGHRNREFLRSHKVTLVYRCRDCGATFFQFYFRGGGYL